MCCGNRNSSKHWVARKGTVQKQTVENKCKQEEELFNFSSSRMKTTLYSALPGTGYSSTSVPKGVDLGTDVEIFFSCVCDLCMGILSKSIINGRLHECISSQH